jgi:hypothetical protein
MTPGASARRDWPGPHPGCQFTAIVGTARDPIVIVRETETALLLIRQPDHAELARGIMEPAAALGHAAHRDSVLHALAEHDNGWREVDAMPTVDPATGRLLDFSNLPAHVRQGVWPRGVARLAADPWAAALVAEHALTVYDRLRADPEWSSFFTRMAAARDRSIAEARRTLDELRHDYVFLRLGDLASLAFCMGVSGEHSVGGFTVRLEGNRLVITPDPYGGRVVPFEVIARELPRRPFASDADARAALAAASVITMQGEAVGDR